MPDDIPRPRLTREVQRLAHRLRDRAPLGEVLPDLRFFLERCEHPAAYATLFLPGLMGTLDAAARAPDPEEFPDLEAFPKDLATVLARLGPATLPTWAGLARNRHAAVRQAAAAAMQQLGPAAAKGAGALVALLDDPEPSVRAQACAALAAVRATRDSARRLARRLDDRSEDVVAEAILGIGQIGDAAAEEIPRLFRFLDLKAYHQNVLCCRALQALANLPVNAGHLPRLRPLLKRDWAKQNDLVTFMELDALAVVLGRLGPAARECVVDLEAILGLDDKVIFPGSKIDVACALLQIKDGNTLAQQTLERFATSDHRLTFLWKLGSLPVAVQGRFWGVVEKLAADPNTKVREAAQEVLQQIRDR